MKIINGNLELKEDITFNESLKVEGNITGDFNLIVKGDLDCRDLICWNLKCRNLDCKDLFCYDLKCNDLKCRNLDCRNLDCKDLICWNLKCRNLDCKDLKCRNLNFYAVAITYKSFKCKSWKARRENHIIKCLDGEIEVT